MKKWMAILLAMLMLLMMAAVPAMAEEDEVFLPDLSFAASGEGIAGWTSALATDLQTDGASMDGTDYLTFARKVNATTDFIPVQNEPCVFEAFYKASADSGYIQVYYYDAEKQNLKSGNNNVVDSYPLTQSSVWMKKAITIQKEGAAYFKIWLRNTNAETTVSYASPKLRLQSEGNLLENGDMQGYTEGGEGNITLSGWTVKSTDGGTVVGQREASGNVYALMTRGTSSYATYMQHAKLSVSPGKTYKLSFRMYGTTKLPNIRVYFYDASNAAAGNNSSNYITLSEISALATPGATAWTEYEAFITAHRGGVEVAYLIINFYCNDETTALDDISLTQTRTNFTFTEAEGNVTVKAHMVAAAPITDESAPVLILCAYEGKKLTDVKMVSGEKADVSLTAAGQFTASATVSAPTGTVVKAFAWDGISGLRPLGKATK